MSLLWKISKCFLSYLPTLKWHWADDMITKLHFCRLKGFDRRQTQLVLSHSSCYMLLYADQGSCTFPYQSTVLNIGDVEPACICFRVHGDTASIQSAQGLGGGACLASCIRLRLWCWVKTSRTCSGSWEKSGRCISSIEYYKLISLKSIIPSVLEVLGTEWAANHNYTFPLRFGFSESLISFRSLNRLSPCSKHLFSWKCVL